MKNMKRTLLAALTLALTVLAATAAPIGKEQARQKALAHLAQMNSGAHSRRAQAQLPLQLAVETPQLYGFNIGSDGGFVIVSADDRTPAILGYADSGSLGHDEALPPALKAWMEWMAEEIATLDQGGTPAAHAPSATRHAIAPMVKTHWNQHPPYNSQCPTHSGQNSMGGCVPVAMAQIMSYHRHPSATIAPIPAYKTRKYGIGVAEMPVTSIPWDSMETAGAAKLIAYCGAAVKADYSATLTEAAGNDVPAALIKYFDYAPTARRVMRASFGTAQWEQMAYDELVAGRPLIYSGVTSSNTGHSFVVDGYNTDGTFHINWGWVRAECDGYFLLAAADGKPDGVTPRDGYSRSQEMLIGLQPNQPGTVYEEEKSLSTRDIQLKSSPQIERNAYGFSGITIYWEVLNAMTTNFEANFGIGLAKGTDIVKVLYAYPAAHDFQPLQYIRVTNDIAIDQSVADGDYRIVLICSEAGTDNWKPTVGSDLRYIAAHIEGNALTLTQCPRTGLTVTDLKYTTGRNAGQLCELEVTLENTGSEFNGELWLHQEGLVVSGNGFYVGPGQSASVWFHFVPSQSTNTIKITTKNANEIIYEGVDENVVPQKLGDLNGDDLVDGADLVVLANIILGKRPYDSSADINGDGAVDSADYNELANLVME